ncbi:helix-turn-helix domain-containing protein [Lactococcus protaetiae]|uniref:Helix-turn-helix transcriptional regulator n=1 Tax=Lactococcus protaetiae TaxID=2592653 RepID=A0A514Z6E7_9LACT|nr:helix-turn-helix transcriptional regulator [Lactococcus protaetiae]QDK70168.1 helix-turn-helix transcriptional regulator [Lactococcus protaetiae]
MLKDRLKTLRHEKRLTQKEVADKLGTSYQTYQQWERGVRTPKIASLNQLAEIFNVSTDYLAGRDDSLDELFNIIRENNPTGEDKQALIQLIDSYFKNRE